VPALTPDKECIMEKLFTFALAIVVCLGTTAMLATSGRVTRQSQSPDLKMVSDGAFRDGLYVGKLAAERGGPQHPLTGRWSNERDRASFLEGYQRGYRDFLAGAGPGRSE
jgi:hypothetical protein